ncbi:MAG: transcription antiterminator [Thermoanaerobacteraceae bacterium]|nr:transcription antiterminator [Thermoanaerobacteraceae bacterium]
MDFTSREIKILNILLEGPSTAGKLAKSLNVSRRTVLRDIPSIFDKLKTYDATLETKTGIGISLVGEIKNINRLKEKLALSYIPPKLSPKERQHLIILSLLEHKEPQKLLSFAMKYRVTEATISNDLDACEHIFLKYNLKLMRRPGVGVWVKGPEKGIRQLVTDLFYKNFNEGQLISILKDKLPTARDDAGVATSMISDEIKNRLLKLVDANMIEQIEQALKEILDELKFPLADSAYVGLMVHIALAMERLKGGEPICMEGNILSSLKSSDEFILAEKLGARLEESLGIKIPEDEMGYITMHLLGAKLRTTHAANEFFAQDNFEAAHMAREILTHAGRKLGEDLAGDIITLEGLILHLKPAISRLKLGMDIRNPLLTQLKQDYKELMDVACSSVGSFEKKYGLKVPESEIGYIALHIGAALERKRHKRVPVILACASGIGSAQMLASRLQKELPQINIVDVVSFLDLNRSIKKYPYVETVITTVPFESDSFNVIQVSPLLDEAEVEKVRSQVKILEKSFVPTFSPGEYKKNQSKDDSNHVLLDLIQGFVLKENISVNKKDKLLDRLILALKDDLHDAIIDEVAKDLQNREKIGGCAVPGTSVSILHTRTRGIYNPFLAVLRLIKSVPMQNMDGKIEDVETILIMLLPEKPQADAVNVMGKISVALLEDSGFVRLLKKGSGTDIIKELVRITRKTEC